MPSDPTSAMLHLKKNFPRSFDSFYICVNVLWAIFMIA